MLLKLAEFQAEGYCEDTHLRVLFAEEKKKSCEKNSVSCLRVLAFGMAWRELSEY